MDTKPLNPIQKNIAAGMSPIIAFLTETTCGEACWNAREEVCRCSCGGKNHGCLKTADGTRPTRQSKIDGFRYELKAVGPQYVARSEDGLFSQAKKINDAVPCNIKYKYRWHENDKGAPARVKKATADQLAKWPELKSAFDARTAAAKLPGMYPRLLDRTAPWPYLLWVKVD